MTTSTDVRANWKILVENYQECLHCSWVHPELVNIVPVYKTGSVVDPARPDGGVNLRGNSFSLTGRSTCRYCRTCPGGGRVLLRRDRLPEHVHRRHGHQCDRVVHVAEGPGETTVVMEYLFAADTIAAPGFDPSEIVEFSELVGKQDYDVSERVQRGVASRYFDHGVLAPQDHLIVDFLATYRSHMTG